MTRSGRVLALISILIYSVERMPINSHLKIRFWTIHRLKRLKEVRETIKLKLNIALKIQALKYDNK